MRIGHGLDVHRVSAAPSRSLWLGLVGVISGELFLLLKVIDLAAL